MALLLLAAAPPAQAQRVSLATLRKCGAARDTMVRALEKVSPGSPASAVSDANDLLKTATSMCSELGDAWYYRSVFEKRLNNPRAAQTAEEQATMLDSEAAQQKLDPFHLAAPPEPATKAPSAPGTRWALIVGVGTFQDKAIEQLAHTADDAELFHKTLVDSKVGGFPENHVKTLVDGEATTKAIRYYLNWIATQAKPQDLVVIYVATHGSGRNMDVAGANYLMTADTQIGPQHDQNLLFATALAMNDLVATVANRISARRTAIFIDTCYSGGTSAAGRGDSVSAQDMRRFNEGAGRIVMTASRDDQMSRDSKKLGHGYFTWNLVEALSAPNGPHKLSAVYSRIAEQVPAQVAADAKPIHVEQNPMMSRSSPDTDFALEAGAE